MAKGKKGGKGKKKKAEEDPNALTEVDKTFYELSIADLNRKLARLRSLTQELEEKNEELQQKIEKVDEDKSDIITYLKRMLQEKTNEISELEERITGLQETRQNETEQFEAKIVVLEDEYKQMHEQLTSENKLLEGKLNSLEEFRSQRDDLLKKFESQEKQMEAQEKRHMREMYEIERKFIISKDKLKKDMEARLLQLSTEFHDASELRIAATTHRVIRENIAVNNELDAMLANHQKMYREHQLLKSRDLTLRQEASLFEAERNKALSKVRVQKKIVERLTTHSEYTQAELNRYKQYEQEVRQLRNTYAAKVKSNKELEFRIRLLEQNLHKIKCENTSLQTRLTYLREENDKLDDTLMAGVSCIKEALTIKAGSDASITSTKRENLLNTLFMLLSQGYEKKIRRPSLDTVSSAEATYALGDLGFVPKPVEPRPIGVTKRNIASQMGDSFTEFLEFGAVDKFLLKKSYVDRDDSEFDIFSGEDGEHSSVEEVVAEEKKSILFFDEQETADDESGGDSKEFDPFAEEKVSIRSSMISATDERRETKQSIEKVDIVDKSATEKTTTVESTTDEPSEVVMHGEEGTETSSPMEEQTNQE